MNFIEQGLFTNINIKICYNKLHKISKGLRERTKYPTIGEGLNSFIVAAYAA